MKISEHMASINRHDSELNKLFKNRENIVMTRFSAPNADLPIEEFDKRLLEFQKNKIEKLKELDEKIRKNISVLEIEKSQLIKTNVKYGMIETIIKIKFLRIQLAKLESISNTNDRFGMHGLMASDLNEELNLSKKIEELEEEKRRLDKKIQEFNWTTDIITE